MEAESLELFKPKVCPHGTKQPVYTVVFKQGAMADREERKDKIDRWKIDSCWIDKNQLIDEKTPSTQFSVHPSAPAIINDSPTKGRPVPLC